MSEDRRNHERVNKRSLCTLFGKHYQAKQCHIINLSLKGALIAHITPHTLSINDEVMIRLEDESEANIEIQCRIAHTKDHYIGLEFLNLRDQVIETLFRLINQN